MNLMQLTDELVVELGRLTFSPPVVFVYNPLVYAREPHDEYLRRYGGGKMEGLFLGMNPGPWGMAQTGVPFGEIGIVREWLKIDGRVGRPPQEHPRKQVEGFGCRRREVSGQRLWGLFRERFGEPDRFFARFFVMNYCPLLFLDMEGRNITPDKLKKSEQTLLLAACDRALRRAVEFLQPGRVIGIGNFAARQAGVALSDLNVPVGKIHHPSPASPTANRNWQETVLGELAAQGIEL